MLLHGHMGNKSETASLARRFCKQLMWVCVHIKGREEEEDSVHRSWGSVVWTYTVEEETMSLTSGIYGRIIYEDMSVGVSNYASAWRLPDCSLGSQEASCTELTQLIAQASPGRIPTWNEGQPDGPLNHPGAKARSSSGYVGHSPKLHHERVLLLPLPPPCGQTAPSRQRLWMTPCKVLTSLHFLLDWERNDNFVFGPHEPKQRCSGFILRHCCSSLLS